MCLNDIALHYGSPVGGLDLYAKTLSETFVPMETLVPASQGFAGQITGVALGPLEVARVQATSHVVRRVPEAIATGGPGYFKVNVQLSGASRLEQDGRSVVLRPGDFALYDTTRPFELHFEENFNVLAMMFPRPMMHLPVPGIDNLTAHRISGESGLGALVAPYVQHIEQTASATSQAAVPYLQSSVLQLLTAVFTAELRPEYRVLETPRAEQLTRAKTFILDNLSSEILNVPAIARATHISTRQLQKLFEEEGTTVSEWIRHRRLKYCCRDLADPLLKNVPIHAIGGRWGFGDPAHFSRVFKSHLGMTPTEYRKKSATF